MVKQGFKNNAVIGISTAAAAGSNAKLLRQARVRVQRRGSIRIKSHLAPEMKTFYRLLWLMIHITKAKSQIWHFWRFSFAFQSSC